MDIENRICRALAACRRYMHGCIDFEGFRQELTVIESRVKFAELDEYMFVSNEIDADFYIDITFTRDEEGYWRLDEYNIGEYEE